jgi:hypothetical protein
MTYGEPIWFRQAQRGGYGFEQDVPGTFVRETAHRIVVRLLLKSGGSTEVAVKPANVRRRFPEQV